MKLTKLTKEKKVIFITSVALGLFMYFLYFLNIFSFWDWKSVDFFFNIRPEPKTNPNIVIVAIDDDSIAKFGKFPWETKIHAKLVDNLAKQKPKVICFDILFDKPDKNPANDSLFAKSIKNAGNVILSMGFIAESKPTNPFKRDSNLTLDMAKARMPIQELRNVALDLGVTNIFPEKDSINRKIYLSIPFGDQYFLTLASCTISHALGVPADKIKIEPNDFYLGNDHIKLDNDGRIIINYYGGVRSFDTVSYVDIYDNKMPEGFFKDKIVVIGGTASGLGDMWATPMSHALPGVEIQTTVMNNILDNNFLQRNKSTINFLLIFLLPILVGLTTAWFSPIKNALIIMGIAICFLIYSYIIFAGKYIISPVATALITMILSFIILNIFKLVFEEKEKKEITVEKEKYYEMATVDGLTQLYVARYFRQRLKEEIEKALKENTQLSFIMIDLDNFKKVNDVYGHEQGNIVLRETAQIIKNTLRSQSDIAARYGGEEMAIILPNTEVSIAFQVANRIREKMASHTFSGFKGFKQITGSFGVSNLPEHAQNETELVERADEALYISKKTGKNKVTMGEKKKEGVDVPPRPEEGAETQTTDNRPRGTDNRLQTTDDGPKAENAEEQKPIE